MSIAYASKYDWYRPVRMLSQHARAKQFYFIDIRVGFSKMIFHVNNADAQKKKFMKVLNSI